MNRDELLRELGLAPLWRLREGAVRPAAGAASAAEVAPEMGIPETAIPEAAMPEPTPAAPPAFEAGLAPSSPVATADAGQTAEAGTAACSIGAGRAGSIAALDWDGLAIGVADCRACGLCRQRRQAVLGVGDRQPDWLLVGEGPGEQEDLRGEPFVGPAGQLLDAMLAAIGLRRGDKVYIANAVKCRPPGNRTPGVDEIAACRPFLQRQIVLLRPKIIVLLGRAAVQAVLDRDVALAGLRGRRHEFSGVPVVVTYHPAYLLRTLPEKAKAWEDLCLARRILRQSAGAVR